MNIGLPFDSPGVVAHRDAFDDLAGRDQRPLEGYAFPELIRDSALAVLKGTDNETAFRLASDYLQALADAIRIPIDLETTDFKETLEPAAVAGRLLKSRLSASTIADWRSRMNDRERLRLSTHP